MESHLYAPGTFMDDLLDFASDFCEEEDDNKEAFKTLTLSSPNTPGIVEEELEWITNRDAFPMVETFVDIIPTQSKPWNHRSPVSVLENSSSSSSRRMASILSLPSSVKVPVRARSNLRKRKREMFGGMQWKCLAKETRKAGRKKVGGRAKESAVIGKKCEHCQTEKTPQWRTGPTGPKTLCNACGVRYKSGRLVPEYRPASSPTFSGEVHSNCHRKIIEMRKKGVMQGVGLTRTTDRD